MQKNGFILIVSLLAVVTRAGSPFYLPSVGPVALRFDSNASASPFTGASDNPALQSGAADVKTGDESKPVEFIAEIPVDPITNSSSGISVLTPEGTGKEAQPIVLPVEPTIGPLMDTNSIITPQMLMKYFTPLLNGNSRETILIPQTGFTPARPPQQSSTVNYSTPRP